MGTWKPQTTEVKGMTSKMAVGKEEFVRLQDENFTLQKFKEAKGR